jgi:hypothetical protein
MRSIRWRPPLKLALRLASTLGFAAALLWAPGQRGMWAPPFVRWGFPAWLAGVTTIAEIIGLIALWIPKLASAATQVLVTILSGAFFTWVIDGWQLNNFSNEALVPFTLAMLLQGLSWLDWLDGPRTKPAWLNSLRERAR